MGDNQFLIVVEITSLPPKPPDLSVLNALNSVSPMYLKMVKSLEASESSITTADADEALTPQEVLMFHPVYSRLVHCLPMPALLCLAMVSRSFSSVVKTERNRGRRHEYEWIYRKEFIRYINLSYASQKVVKEVDIFAGIMRELYCYPESILVFYTPDIFQYDLRVLGKMQ